ncbi:conjugal transfer protein [Mesorhizobium sp. M0598]|uniref:TrbI/VirB10 family protein n=1 Tax=Mesorhizobium sp. M0598 TaxID=2956968 RepID=UPI00333A0AFD
MPDKSGEIDHRPDHNAEQKSVEREKLIEERRARQMGKLKRGTNRRVVVAAIMLAGVVVAVVVTFGPTQALKMLGLGGDDEEKTSQIDLNVGSAPTNPQHLDFLVPEPPAVAETEADRNAGINKRLDELRKEIDALGRRSNVGSDFSLADVNKLLERHNKEMAQKFHDEREKAKAEEARLGAKAARIEVERKRGEDAAKLGAEKRRQQEEINTKQRESKGVVVDESGAHHAVVGGIPQVRQHLSVNDRFLASEAGSETKTSVSRALPNPSLTVVQGTIISAVLETAIDTEMPGNIRALIIEPVFSFDGSRILLPPGTNLIGAFNNETDIEQKRVLIAWNRAITPEGKSIALGSTGTDLLGRAGTAGNVDNRYAKKVGAAVLISAITALPSAIPAPTGSSRSSREGGATVNLGGAGTRNNNADGQAASDITGALSDQGKGILDKYLSLPPVLRVPQGEEIRVFVNQDLVIR